MPMKATQSTATRRKTRTSTPADEMFSASPAAEPLLPHSDTRSEEGADREIRLVFATQKPDEPCYERRAKRNARDTAAHAPASPRHEIGDALTSHIAGLRRYARALLGNSSDVDDLVQECLTRALERVRSWGKIKDTRAYLFTILHNVHVDRLSKQRRAGAPVPLEYALPHLAIGPTQISRLEMRDLAWALKQIPVDQRQVILLVGLEGITYQEVADLLGIPIGTVMSRLSRGREALRRLMADGSAVKLRLVAS